MDIQTLTLLSYATNEELSIILYILPAGCTEDLIHIIRHYSNSIGLPHSLLATQFLMKRIQFVGGTGKRTEEEEQVSLCYYFMIM